MPLTELLAAVYAVSMIARYSKALSTGRKLKNKIITSRMARSRPVIHQMTGPFPQDTA